jgi:hypothetical protein
MKIDLLRPADIEGLPLGLSPINRSKIDNGEDERCVPPGRAFHR